MSTSQRRTGFLSAPGATTGRIGFLSSLQLPSGTGHKPRPFPGDFNGDGKKDVGFVSYDFDYSTSTYAASFTVAFGKGDGTFENSSATPIGNLDPWTYSEIQVGDLNGDHKDDFVVTRSGGTIDVYLGLGDGTFSGPFSENIGFSQVAGARLADINGDGKLDLTVISSGGVVVTALGNGDGTFQAGISVSYQGNVGPAVVADFDGDGKLDFAGFDNSTGQIAVYLADGAGGFQQPQLVSQDADPNVCSIEAGDLNGDGKPELATTNCDYVEKNLTIFVNDGHGTFSNGISQWAGFEPADLAIADVNGDNKNDIILVNAYGADVTVLLGNGDGTVRPPELGFAVGGYPWHKPVIADFNSDGKLDLVVSNDVNGLDYLQGYGDGTFRAAQNFFAPLPTDGDYPWSNSVASGDFNGDGIPDVVVGNCCSASFGVTVFLGNPDGSLQRGVNYPGDNLQYVATGDFNGDGKLDFVATSSSSSSSSVQLYLGNGDGTFQPPQVFADPDGPNGVVAADLNGDGKLDVAVVNSDATISVLLNDGNGGFLAPSAYAIDGDGYAIASADLNGDGKVDLVVADEGNESIDVLLGNGDGTFLSSEAVATGFYSYGVAVGDLNGDGKVDIVASAEDQGTIVVLLGNGDGTFQDAVMYPATLGDTAWDTPEPGDIRISDIDGDGKPDLVFVNAEFGTVGVLYGKGDGTFDGPLEFPTGGYPWGLTVQDMNGDGAPDVVTANDDMIGSTVLLNAGGNKVQVTASPNPAQYGETVTLAARVSPTVRGVTAMPSGTVQIATVNTTFGTPTLTNGAATLELSSLAPGTYNTGVIYSGDTNFRPGSGGISFVVDKATTTTVVASSSNPSIIAHSVIFTATVTPGTSGVPTGTVTFMDGQTTLGTGVLDAAGKATFSTSSLAVATHPVTAVYGGDANYAVSTSAELNQVVNDLSVTSTTLTSSKNPVITGKSVTFTAAVSSTATGTITGNVSFKEGTTTLGTGALDATGKATFSSTSLAAGTHNVTAVYGGDADFATSTSVAVSQVVLANAPDYTLTANPTSATIRGGESATFTLTATADQYFNGTVTLDCGSLPTGVTCNFSQSTLTPTNGHPVQSTLTVTTTSQRAALAAPALPGRNNGLILFACLGTFGALGGLFLGKNSKRQRRVLVVLAFAMFVLGMTACGSSTKKNPNATPIGTSTVQVTASATAGTTDGNTTAHNVTVTVNVQK